MSRIRRTRRRDMHDAIKAQRTAWASRVEHVRTLRDDQNLSFVEIARELRLSPSAVSALYRQAVRRRDECAAILAGDPIAELDTVAFNRLRTFFGGDCTSWLHKLADIAPQQLKDHTCGPRCIVDIQDWASRHGVEMRPGPDFRPADVSGRRPREELLRALRNGGALRMAEREWLADLLEKSTSE